MSADDSDIARDLDYYDTVPYLLVMDSVERGGEWLRRAQHPELPGCVVEAPSAFEAIEKLEQERLRLLPRRADPRTPAAASRLRPGDARIDRARAG